MASITNTIRKEISELINDELMMVENRARVVAETHWKEAEQELANRLGYGDALIRVECLQAQIAGLQKELAQLEGSMTEKAQPASVDDYMECGIEVATDRYGRVYSKPVVFGREIRTVWDTQVLKQLNESLSFFQVYQNVHQLRHSVKRELLFSGTFEDARGVYYRFHEKITEALGDRMPKLLRDVDSIPALKEPRG